MDSQDSGMKVYSVGNVNQSKVIQGEKIIESGSLEVSIKGSRFDLERLVSDLSKLRRGMREQAQEPEHDVEIGVIASAEKEAKSGNQEGALSHLKKAGHWALEIASKVGANLAESAIKQSLGIP